MKKYCQCILHIKNVKTSFFLAKSKIYFKSIMLCGECWRSYDGISTWMASWVGIYVFSFYLENLFELIWIKLIPFDSSKAYLVSFESGGPNLVPHDSNWVYLVLFDFSRPNLFSLNSCHAYLVSFGFSRP